MNHYHSNLEAIVDWHQFVEDCSIQYGVSMETVYKIAMDIFILQKQLEKRP